MKEAEEKLLRPLQEQQQDGSHFSLSLFRWAVSMVLSRSFEVGDEEGREADECEERRRKGMKKENLLDFRLRCTTRKLSS
eukprot:554256-Hanusia_phi.AAC.1